MALFKKKTDPISDRARTLNQRIASLEEEIHRLNSRIAQAQSQPRLRSTALPHGPRVAPAAEIFTEPIFEPVDVRKNGNGESETTPSHYNELGVRKYDLLAVWHKLQQQFRGPATTNPKLVSYLAAGSIKGLRPLRYEKRVARNRFLLLFFSLVLILWGTAYMFFRS
ncbi:MAG: hypothetical protein AB1813_01265 [Verrucomicrobiota bacterium]